MGKPKRQGSPTVTPELAAKAKFLVMKRGLFQHQAAAILGINQGRISEIITGKRFPDVPPDNQLSLDFD